MCKVQLPVLPPDEKQAKENYLAGKSVAVWPRKSPNMKARKAALDAFESKQNKVDDYGCMD